jgi:RNA polymerase sigma-70 factor, ECF subfamily
MEIRIIYTQFHKILTSYVVSHVNNQDDAEDIVQEVFIKIAANIHTLSDKDKLKSWIFTIARNSITDYYRKNAKNAEVHIADHHLNETEEEISIDASKGLDICLEGFIQKLPEEYRGIIIDSEIKGIKQKDLVDKYNLQYPSIRSRVQRGRTQLKELLLNCCEIELNNRGNIVEAIPKNMYANSCNECQ